MEILYFTAVAVGLYFMSDWLLDQAERARGKRFANRQLVFFAIILVLALATFQLMNVLMRPSGPSPEAPPPGTAAPQSPR
jgi:cell division protein FtsW (lipid II flippase)